MRRLFADTVHWIALGHSKDQWHPRAMELSRQIGPALVVTTDDVLDEFLAHFAAFGPEARGRCVRTVRRLLRSNAVEVVPHSRGSFLEGLDLYDARADKEYSLTDCISMCVMRREGIVEVLTRDAHFAQEGFVVLY